MKEVTKDELYGFIGDMEGVEVGLRGDKWPYTAEWKLKGTGKVVAKIVGSLPEGRNWPEIEKYYIEDNTKEK